MLSLLTHTLSCTLPSLSLCSLGNWLTFLNERAPPLVFVLLVVGPTLSGLQLTEGFVDVEKFFWAAFGLWVRPCCRAVGGALEY